MNKTTSEQNQDVAYKLSNNLVRLLLEFSKDFERRVLKSLQARGHEQIRASHSILFSNLGLGAVRVTELANRAQVTQQAMGKMLKEEASSKLFAFLCHDHRLRLRGRVAYPTLRVEKVH